MGKLEELLEKDIKELQTLLKTKQISKIELKAILDRIKQPKTTKEIQKHYWGDRRVKIGLCGDIHIGSIYADYETLNDVFKRFKKEGVDAIYVTGDITEGYNRRKGHSLECDLHGADAQIEGVVTRFPNIGKPIYFITGDHDMWHHENQGIDVGTHIAEKRKDMKYLGPFSATIELARKVKLMLVHPAKGTSYALSYQIQKMIEALSGGEKPNLLAVGHYHKIEYLFYRNIHCVQTGCIQSQTDWMKRMNLSAHKGAWILDLSFKTDGTIDKLIQTLYPYY